MALRSLHLRDFVIVQQLELDLHGGFTVLTGETGAGKSILIDALQFALGSRADAGVIREGAARTEVSACFDTTPAVRAWLAEEGFDAGDEAPDGAGGGAGELLLRRTLDAQGRSRGWINGGSATAAQLRALGEHLLDIHGQHAWQSLTRAASVRALLDAYAGVAPGTLDAPWQAWRAAEHALAEARAAQQTLAAEQERLAWQLQEVDKLAPGAHEWDELNAEHTRLSHAQSLIDTAQEVLQRLEDETAGAVDGLSRAQSALAAQAAVEPAFGAVAEVLGSALAQAEDAVHTLHAWLRRTSPDPERLAELDARLSAWMALARRHRCLPQDLPALRARWHAEAQRLDAAADLDALEAAARRAEAALREAAAAVSAKRRKAAPRLAAAITAALQTLGMQGGRFEVALQPLPEPTAAGLEDVAFLVAGHAGSAPRPVGKVASGGELSRIALAIAVSTSALGEAPTLIFDEIDVGIGGAVADTVGRLMQQLGRDRQVLTVTHLAQVAARADHHLRVSKAAGEGGRTTSGVHALDAAERVQEIARMIGGERRTDTTLAHARELLEAGARSAPLALAGEAP